MDNGQGLIAIDWISMISAVFSLVLTVAIIIWVVMSIRSLKRRVDALERVNNTANKEM